MHSAQWSSNISLENKVVGIVGSKKLIAMHGLNLSQLKQNVCKLLILF